MDPKQIVRIKRSYQLNLIYLTGRLLIQNGDIFAMTLNYIHFTSILSYMFFFICPLFFFSVFPNHDMISFYHERQAMVRATTFRRILTNHMTEQTRPKM